MDHLMDNPHRSSYLAILISPWMRDQVF